MMRRALSLREHTCLHWAAQGKPSREIAQLLGVSERTINFHLQNACRKLSARNRRVAVVTALAMGLLDLDGSNTPAPDTDAGGFTGGIATNARMFAPPPVAAYPPGR